MSVRGRRRVSAWLFGLFQRIRAPAPEPVEFGDTYEAVRREREQIEGIKIRSRRFEQDPRVTAAQQAFITRAATLGLDRAGLDL